MYNKKTHIHFIGIGGIGMSGIATILKHQGYTISGCDSDMHQQSIINLQNIGCSVFQGNNTSFCTDPHINVIVYSSIIKPDNIEIINAQKKGIATIPRAIMLAELMRTKYSIAIAGAHGKTTTTSLLSHILIEAGVDPTVIIGGHLKTLSTSARFGLSDFLVAEADESDRSLLFLHPTLAIVTNIDLEHLETYRDLDDIKQTFQQFLSSLPFYGKAFVCADDPHISSLPAIPHITTIRYGFNPQNDIFATDIISKNNCSQFTLHSKLSAHSTLSKNTKFFDHNELSVHKELGDPSALSDQSKLSNTTTQLGTITLNMPGNHNILNALGAIAVALDLDVPLSSITKALANFQGVDQRFTCRGIFKGATIVDDYGHHPKEIEVTLAIARQYTDQKFSSKQKLTTEQEFFTTEDLFTSKDLSAKQEFLTQQKLSVVFQPHRFTRTYHLWDYFIKVFLESSIDNLIITDIFPASELPMENINSKRFAEALQALNPSFSVTYIPYENNMHTLETHIRDTADQYDTILFLGAGKINKLSQKLVS